jgi:cell division protein FtsW
VSLTSPAGPSARSDEPDDPARPARARSTKSGRTGRAAALSGRLGKLWASGKKLSSDWLDRPMTSLHLILGIFALMLGFGLLMVLSSSSVAAFRAAGSSFSVFANQATYAAVGLVCFCAAQFLPVRLMRSLSTVAVIVALAMLVAVLIPGIGAKVNGATSWIRFGGLQFQPSEIAKLALLLWMAHVLAARRSTLGSPKALLIPVLPVFALMAVLIMLQPDLGTTVALTIVFMAVLFFAGAPWWMFASLGAAGVAGFFYLAVSADYRLARLLSFIDPEAHPDVSYQLLQSLYGLGNGGWFGVGLGQSRAKWSYLPNADSDFIFAIIGEELGLIGAGILLLLFALLAYTGMRIARRNVDPFVKIVASAATVWLVGQAAINIGYVVGLLPVTGIPLPMISSGGTSLLITMVVFGLLANFARREPQAAAALQAGGGGRLAQFLGMRPSDPAAKAAKPRRRAGSRATDPRAGRNNPGRPGSGGPGPSRRGAVRPRPSQPRGTDPRKADPRGSDPRKADPRGSDPRKADPRVADPRKADPRGGRPRSADPREADPRGTQPRPTKQGSAQPRPTKQGTQPGRTTPGANGPDEPRRRPGRRGGA